MAVDAVNLRSQKQRGRRNSEFKANVVYIESSKTFRTL